MSSDKLLEALKRDRNKKTRPKRLVIKEEGKYKMRLLPNKANKDGLPYEKVFLHFGFTHPNYQNPSTFRCLGKDCPLCREAKKMKEEGRPDSWKFKSTPVFLYYVADSNDNFRFIRLSNTAHNEVVEELTAKAQAKINPIDLEQGRIAEIKLSKTEGNKNKYKCFFANEASPVSQEIRTELDMSPLLSDIYRKYTQDELEKIARGEKLDLNSNKETQEGEPEEDDSYTSASSTTARTSMRLTDDDDAPLSKGDDSSKNSEIEEAKRRIRESLGDE